MVKSIEKINYLFAHSWWFVRFFYLFFLCFSKFFLALYITILVIELRTLVCQAEIEPNLSNLNEKPDAFLSIQGCQAADTGWLLIYPFWKLSTQFLPYLSVRAPYFPRQGISAKGSVTFPPAESFEKKEFNSFSLSQLMQR